MVIQNLSSQAAFQIDALLNRVFPAEILLSDFKLPACWSEPSAQGEESLICIAKVGDHGVSNFQ